MNVESRELSELSQIARQNCLVLRPHKGATPEQQEQAAGCLGKIAAAGAAQILGVEDGDIVELQRFRADHIRIRLREPAAAQAAIENMKADPTIFAGPDLPVKARQQVFDAVRALEKVGLRARMAGKSVKYMAAGSQTWEYVDPSNSRAMGSIQAAQQNRYHAQNQQQRQQLQIGDTQNTRSPMQRKRGGEQQIGSVSKRQQISRNKYQVVLSSPENST